LFALSLRWLAAGLIALLVFGGPAAYSTYRNRHFRNLRVVEDHVLYRSGQLSLNGLEQVVGEHGIRTVITLRDSYVPGEPPPDLAEEMWCKSRGIKHVRLSPRRWWSADDRPPPAQENIDTFLNVMDNPANHPVLIHCMAGVHRTGAHVAVFRMEYHRWSTAAALAEVRLRGYSNLDGEEDVLGFLEGYVPRWKQLQVTRIE